MTDISDDQATKIKFRFCRNCANLLYPDEDKEAGQLIFVCRHCNLHEKAESYCVYRNDLSNTVGETAGITQDVGSDPTVGDDGHVHSFAALSLQENKKNFTPAGAAKDDAVREASHDSFGDASSELPLCTMCGQEIVCERCGEGQDDAYMVLEVDDFDTGSMVGGDMPSRPQSRAQTRTPLHVPMQLDSSPEKRR